MTAEKKPITSLQTKEASYQSKVTAYGSLTSALSTFQSSVKALASASLFQGTKARGCRLNHRIRYRQCIGHHGNLFA